MVAITVKITQRAFGVKISLIMLRIINAFS